MFIDMYVLFAIKTRSIRSIYINKDKHFFFTLSPTKYMENSLISNVLNYFLQSRQWLCVD